MSNPNMLDGDTTEYGFVWESGEISYRPDKGSQTVVSLGDAPYVKVVDVPKFESHFPGVILGAVNTTSIKVLSQAITRRARKANRKVTDAEMRPMVLNGLRGVKNRSSVVQVRTFIFGGKEFATAEAARTFAIGVLRTKGLDDEMIEDILSTTIGADEEELDEVDA